MDNHSVIEDDDREHWNQAWSTQRHYHIAMPLMIDVEKILFKEGGFWGRVISATISENPLGYSERVFYAIDDCPLCGQTTDGSDRITASLHLEFENEQFQISMGVWSHKECIETCSLINGAAPIPW